MTNLFIVASVLQNHNIFIKMAGINSGQEIPPFIIESLKMNGNFNLYGSDNLATEAKYISERMQGYPIELSIKLLSADNYFLQVKAAKELRQADENMAERVNEYNKSYEKNGGTVVWMKENRNFGVKRNIYGLTDVLDYSEARVVAQLMTFVKMMLETLRRCIDDTVMAARISQCQKINSQGSIHRRYHKLELLKFMFEQNRKRRAKATKIGLYHPLYKTLNEYQLYRENYQKLKEEIDKFISSEESTQKITLKEAQSYYDVCIARYELNYNKKINSTSGERKKQHILNGIRIQDQGVTATDEKVRSEGGYGHITICQVWFTVIFSTNTGTNNDPEVRNQNKIQVPERDKLVKKARCTDKCCPASYKQNQVPFETEVQILTCLKSYNHPSICKYYARETDINERINQIYSRKLPRGAVDLQEYAKSLKVSPLKKTIILVKFLYNVVSGLYFLHHNKIIHRDLKPANVMIDRDNKPKIIDFGSACPIFGSSNSIPEKLYSRLRSTINYYNAYSGLPEFVKKQYEKQQYNRHQFFDMYSLGVMAQFLLEGLLSYNQIAKVPEQAQDSLSYFFNKCMEQRPDDRLSPLEAAVFLSTLIWCLEESKRNTAQEANNISSLRQVSNS